MNYIERFCLFILGYLALGFVLWGIGTLFSVEWIPTVTRSMIDLLIFLIVLFFGGLILAGIFGKSD